VCKGNTACAEGRVGMLKKFLRESSGDYRCRAAFLCQRVENPSRTAELESGSA
jgi:hypothetical protein